MTRVLLAEQETQSIDTTAPAKPAEQPRQGPFRSRSGEISRRDWEKNSELETLVKESKFEQAVAFAEKLLLDGNGDIRTLVLLQISHYQLKQFQQACAVVDTAHNRRYRGRSLDELYRLALRAAGQLQNLPKLRRFFALLQQSATTSIRLSDYEVLLVGESKQGSLSDVLGTLATMKLQNFVPTPWAFGELLDACRQQNDYLRLRKVLSFVPESLPTKPFPKHFLFNLLNCGVDLRSTEALALFVRELVRATEPAFRTTAATMREAMSVAASRGDVALVRDLINVFELLGYQPGLREQCFVLEAYAVLGDVEKTILECNRLALAGLKLLPSVRVTLELCLARDAVTLDTAYSALLNHRQQGNDVSVIPLNLIISGCANIFELDRAFATFAEVTREFNCQPDVHCFTALIHGCAMLRQVTTAFQVFGEMRDKGIAPIGATTSNLILACVRANDLDRGLKILEAAKAEGMPLNWDSYSLLICKLARLGKTAQARSLLAEAQTALGELASPAAVSRLNALIERGPFKYSDPDAQNPKPKPERERERERAAVKPETAVSVE